MSSNLTRLWGRFGITIEATPDEVETLVRDTNGSGKTVLSKIFAEGRAKFDDESYIPGVSLEHYNRENGTHYDCYDVDLNADKLQGAPVKADLSVPEIERQATQKDRGDAR